ncbi:winged helix-turn-helix domain-containing protein [Vibrio lentus]|nr:winged helix-turn-helix domain-containing protein [Vibrio lentus]
MVVNIQQWNVLSMFRSPRLRRLVEEDPSKPRYIQTVWGLGYVFVPDGKAV